MFSATSCTLVRLTINIAGRAMSLRLEQALWQALHEIAVREKMSIHDLISTIFIHKYPGTSLVSAIRVYAISYFRDASTEEGHAVAEHGPRGTRQRDALSTYADVFYPYTKTR